MKVNHDSSASLEYESRQSMVQTSGEICGYKSNTVGECSNFDQTNCVCQLPQVKKFIKWDVGIFFCNITVWFWVPCIIFSQVCYVDFLCFWHVFLFFPLVIISFVLSFVDICFSPLAKFLRRQGKKTEDTLHFLGRLRAAPPDIAVEIKCFHDKTRYAGFRSQIVEKVTHKEQRIFPLDGFTDQRNIPPVKQEAGVTMVQIYKRITPGDNYSQDTLHYFREQLISANTWRDLGIHDTTILSAAGVGEEVVMTCQEYKPWWTRRNSFYLLSILNIGIILRILFTTKPTYTKVFIEKSYFVDPAVSRTYDFHNNCFSTQDYNNTEQLQYGVGYVPLEHDTVPSQLDQQGNNCQDLPPKYEEHHKFQDVS